MPVSIKGTVQTRHGFTQNTNSKAVCHKGVENLTSCNLDLDFLETMFD